jgi:DNA-binding NarL/FixJ family response regulator
VSKLNVLLIDDHQIAREGIKRIIELKTQMKIIAEANTVAVGISMIERFPIDLAIIDMKLSDGDGLMVAQYIRNHYPKMKIIILTAHTDLLIFKTAMDLNVEGYMLKSANVDALVEAIIEVSQGRRVYDAETKSRYQGWNQTTRINHSITRHERYILQAISEGDTNKEIANKLKISEKTVRNAITLIFEKIRVSNRTEAAIYYLSHKDETNQ